MNARVSLAFAAALAALATGLAAQTHEPPVRQIGPITAVTKDSLASVTAAVEVAGGRVYLNDITAHRVLLFDSTLDGARVVADSGGTAANAYGARPGTLLRFRGDSALLVTPASLSMLVLSPSGEITRVMAMPPSGTGMPGMPALIGSIFGTPGFDANNRLVYFAPVLPNFRNLRPQDGPVSLQPPDSALIVRFDFRSRTLDTVGSIRIPHSHSTMSRDDQGKMHLTVTAFPPAPVDDWAVTSDGRLAVVRGRDYHVEWLGADGQWTATPRVTFAWEHLDDSAKAALVDSMQTAMQAAMDSMPARMQRASGGGGGPVVESTRDGRGPGGAGSQTMTIVVGPGPGPGGDHAPATSGPSAGGGPMRVQMATPTVIKAAPADVPDYRPAFGQGAVRSDVEGNLWVRTTRAVDGRPVYDVVNSRGELVDRVQLPPFRTIAGFGPGVIYMGVQDSTGAAHLERARIR